MIPAPYRLPLDSKHKFLGKKHNFSWGILVIASSVNRQWAVTISKKAAPKATDRNRLRRQIIQYMYSHRHQLQERLSFRLIVNKPAQDSKTIIEQVWSLLSTKA